MNETMTRALLQPPHYSLLFHREPITSSSCSMSTSTAVHIHACTILYCASTQKYVHAFKYMYVTNGVGLSVSRKIENHAYKMGTRAALLALLFVCCLLCALAEGKPTQKTVAIDVKPSGQVAHQSVKLVRGVHYSIRSRARWALARLTVTVVCSAVLCPGRWNHLRVHACSSWRY